MAFQSASAVAPVAVPAAFKPLGLATGFAPLCPDLQVAAVLSQRGSLCWPCSALPQGML